MINFILHELAVLAKIFHVTSDVLLLFIPVFLIALLVLQNLKLFPIKYNQSLKSFMNF